MTTINNTLPTGGVPGKTDTTAAPRPAPPADLDLAKARPYSNSDDGSVVAFSLGGKDYNVGVNGGKVQLRFAPAKEGETPQWRDLTPLEQSTIRKALEAEAKDDHGGTAIDVSHVLAAIPKAAGWAGGQVTVARGDNLTGIAKNVDRSLQDIKGANPQIKNPNLIHPGDKVNVPSKLPSAPMPLYGMYIRESITRHQGQVAASVDRLNGLLARTDLTADQRTEAQTALKSLKDALVDLGESRSEADGRTARFDSNESPTKQLVDLRQNVQVTIASIRTGLSSGQLTGNDAVEAQKSLADLQRVYASLDLSKR